MGITTTNELFYSVVERNRERVMLRREASGWRPISARELYRDAVGAARGLAAWGIAKGDRVAILSENRAEWAIADFAAQLLGAVVVPVYPTLLPDQVEYLLRDSGARIIFLSTVDQFNKFSAIRDQVAVKKAVIMEPVPGADAIAMRELMESGPENRDAEFDARARAIRPDDLATIIYTSGTTGRPKGVMLTHGNLMSNLVYSGEELGMRPDDLLISYLPLSHITARHVDYVMFKVGVSIAYCPRVEEITQALLEVRPTLFVGVPRVYEKIRAQVEARVSSGLKRRLYQWALGVGRRYESETLAGRQPSSLSWALANNLLFARVRHGLGGRIRVFISGGAPLGRELAQWFAWIGIRIHEGYGLTETSPLIALNLPHAHKLGTVGKPLPNLEVKIAADGEILVRGPSVFRSYWNLPEETRAALEDGWFKTGDIGRIDEDGFLLVTDRKKDLIKTSGGKFIVPQPIESRLRNHDLVSDAVIIGDRHKFPAVLIVPDFERLEAWARGQGLKFAAHEQLVGLPEVRGLYQQILEETNRDLAQFEKMKKMLLLAEGFTVANGALTPTMKLRRRAVEERYRQRIEQLYADSTTETVVSA